MKWNNTHIKQYLQAKEYVDSLLIPLIPIQLSDSKIKKSALQNEAMFIYSNEIERELTGRVMLFPEYHYLGAKDLQMESTRVNHWIKEAKENSFKHIYLLTFDSTWKKIEQQIDGTLIWLPAISSGNIYSEEISQMIRDQVNELIELIRSYW